jgi:site-specific recombinase XerD
MADPFQHHLSAFLLEYLPRIRGYSPNTVMAYRDAFVTLLRYLKDIRHIPVESVSFDDLTRNSIEEYLKWLSECRNLSASTCNQRLAAIKSFFRYVAYSAPEFTAQASSIIAIDKRKTAQKQIPYLSLEAIGLLLDKAADIGIRQLALLSLLYDTGARVQEISDLSIDDFQNKRPHTIKVIGKGRKARIIPLTPQVAKIVSQYMGRCRQGFAGGDPLFVNRDGDAIGRAGIAYILNSCADIARVERPDLIPSSITPHMLRHSKAMHLLDNGVNLIYIRDFLGHSSVMTTEIYAKANPEHKRRALENANIKIIKGSRYKTKEKKDLLNWLKENI